MNTSAVTADRRAASGVKRPELGIQFRYRRGLLQTAAEFQQTRPHTGVALLNHLQAERLGTAEPVRAELFAKFVQQSGQFRNLHIGKHPESGGIGFPVRVQQSNLEFHARNQKTDQRTNHAESRRKLRRSQLLQQPGKTLPVCVELSGRPVGKMIDPKQRIIPEQILRADFRYAADSGNRDFS